MWRYNERKKDENQNTNGGATRMRDSDNNEKKSEVMSERKTFQSSEKKTKRKKGKRTTLERERNVC